MTRLVIIGAGGHGAVVADAAASCNVWSEIVFLDDKNFRGMNVLGFPVIGRVSDWIGLIGQDTEFFVAIGNNSIRLEVLQTIEDRGGRVATVMHPSAVISSYSNVDLGVVICAKAVINPRVTVGKGSIINTAATIDHDCVIGDSVHVSPGVHIAGNVVVGSRSWFGIASSVKEGIHVGEDVVVGAGAVVISDVPPGITVVGVPAKPIAR